MSVGANVFVPVWNLRRESGVHAMGYKIPRFPNKPQGLPVFFQKSLWGQLRSPQSGRQDETVRSLPWAPKIQHFQTSLIACLVFVTSVCGDKCVRPSLKDKTRKSGPCHGLRKSNISKQHFHTSLRDCLVFFRTGCGDKCFRPSPGPKPRKRGPCHGLRKSNISQPASEPALFFQSWVRGQMCSPKSRAETRK